MLDNDISTSGVSPERLARLLGMGLEESARPEPNPPKPIAELLQARLADTLCKELMPLSEKPLGEVLLDPDTDLKAVKTIKEYAKELAVRKSSEADHASAIAMYYAAIASALAFHDEKITTHSYEYLRSAFAELVEKPWLPPELATLFVMAAKACRDDS